MNLDEILDNQVKFNYSYDHAIKLNSTCARFNTQIANPNNELIRITTFQYNT